MVPQRQNRGEVRQFSGYQHLNVLGNLKELRMLILGCFCVRTQLSHAA